MAKNADEIIELFRSAVREVENKELKELDPNSSLAELGLDSVATMEVIGVMEERLHVQFPDEDLAELSTLSDLTVLVQKLT